MFNKNKTPFPRWGLDFPEPSQLIRKPDLCGFPSTATGRVRFRRWNWAARLAAMEGTSQDRLERSVKQRSPAESLFTIHSIANREFYRDQGLTANLFFKKREEIIEQLAPTPNSQCPDRSRPVRARMERGTHGRPHVQRADRMLKTHCQTPGSDLSNARIVPNSCQAGWADRFFPPERG
jgi:hypothetical protein